MANAHRRRNFLAEVKVNGAWLFKDSDIKEGVTLTFHNLLSDLEE